MKFKYITLIYGLLIAIGIWLLVNFWLSGGYIIAGHDSGLALSTKQFLLTRLSAWDNTIGFGRDNSQHFGSITIHFIDYFSSLLANTNFAGNKVNLFFWLVLIFESALFFAYSFKDRVGKYFVFLFPVLATFNFYLAQSIFIIERAKYGLYAAQLLFLAVSFLVINKKISIILASILSSLMFFLFNGGSWLGLPLWGGIIITFLTLTFFVFVNSVKKKQYPEFHRLIIFLLTTFLGFVILSSYSIWPYLYNFIKTRDYRLLVNSQDLPNNKAWLDYVSQGSTFLNLIRFEGVPDWYADRENLPNPDHSYATDYITNPVLIIISYIFPLLAMMSFLFKKKKKEIAYINFFGLLLLVAMFFSAGTRSSFGFIYAFLYDHLPGFIIFRSPYYKFGGTIVIALSFLICFTLNNLLQNVSKKFRFLSWFVAFLLICGWLFFNKYYFSSNLIFKWQKDLTTKIEVPNYVVDAISYLKLNIPEDNRILLLPSLNNQWKNDAYNWGYWSLSSLVSSFGNNNILTNESSLNSEENEWVDKLYKEIKDRDELNFYDTAQKLGVTNILLRNDVLTGNSWSALENPELYKQILDSFSNVKLIKSFDNWEIYEIEEIKQNVVSSTTELIVVPDKGSYLGRDSFNVGHYVLSKDNHGVNKFISNYINVFNCQSCLFEYGTSPVYFPNVTIYPNSPLYKIKDNRENKTLNSITDDESKIDAYLGFSMRRTSEVKGMVDAGIDDKYIVKNVLITNDYITNLYDLVIKHQDINIDYYRAYTIINYLDPIESFYRKLIQRSDFINRNEKIRQGTLDILWKIRLIKEHFGIKTFDLNLFRTDKVFYIDIPRKGDYDIIINNANNFKEIEIIDGNKKVSKIIDYGIDGNKIDFNYKSQAKETITINIKYDKLDNLYKFDSYSIEKLPLGDISCIVGRIDEFDAKSRYVLDINLENWTSGIKLYLNNFKSSNPNDALKLSFLKGTHEVDVRADNGNDVFTYTFSVGDEIDPRVYLCGSNIKNFNLSRINLNQINSPNIVIVENTAIKIGDVPEIEYTKVSNNKYLVQVKEAKNPFILIFNKRYSPLWKIVGNNYQQFIVDGYSNAWSIDKTGDFQFEIEYVPQKIFNISYKITLVFLILLLFIIYLVLKNKKIR